MKWCSRSTRDKQLLAATAQLLLLPRPPNTILAQPRAALLKSLELSDFLTPAVGGTLRELEKALP